jgi:hypothetical protein
MSAAEVVMNRGRLVFVRRACVLLTRFERELPDELAELDIHRSVVLCAAESIAARVPPARAHNPRDRRAPSGGVGGAPRLLRVSLE